MDAQQKPKIELVKPPAGTKGYDRGERMIYVDGVQWGRTFAQSHGMHGLSYSFGQEGASGSLPAIDRKKPGAINERRDAYGAVSVFPGRARRREASDPTPEQQVLAQIEKLIEQGRLLHPDRYREEQRRAHERFRAQVAEADAKKDRAFAAKAREALSPLEFNDAATAGVINELVDRVVEAMKWAQSQ